ncbi:hypothetical protein [Chlorobium phaeovibrioides]|uniref:CopG family transcriptional regulator n=1 Tax=Chlorobium phaeovibrioides TaxID=1094 RepID=A0A5M8I7V9_CHLPH|nr:hypothetical protein [Chlorobium phaeovibrioides]KAA6230472.1 hypothetical protein FP507_10645 [Chlorobium phaeovibrioides]MWV55316.1 hypothetical protein [Chlorobium phaeovibrioides]
MTTKRKNIHPYLSPELYQRFKSYCKQKGVTESSVVESALTQYLDEKCDLALILKKLDRIGRGVNRVDNQVNISAEAFGLFLQYWFAHTPEIAEEEKSLANADAKRRYRSFIDYLTQRLGAGSRFTDELVKDFVVGDDDELRQATRLAEGQTE